MDIPLLGKNIKIFVSYMDAYQVVTSAEEDFISQMERMTYFVHTVPFHRHCCDCPMGI